MERLKRLLALAVSVIVAIIGLGQSMAFADNTESTVKNNAAGFIEYLNIISDKADSLYGQTVSRGDFAEYLAKLLKIDSGADENGRYFIDVTGYDYAESAINALVDANIISVDAERHFRPADPILKDEAVKMVVSALGYRPKAEAWGGYPYGYSRVAKQQGIVDDIDDGTFTLNDAAQILFNALITPLYSVESISSGDDGGYNYSYTDSDGSTLLNTLYSMGYKKDVLTGADGIDIRREVSSSDKSVIIGGTDYYTDNAAEYTSFIGCEVFGIYEDTTNKLVYVFKPRNGGEKITEIDISDFISYTKDEIKYYVKDRTVSANITDAVLLFNGAPIKRNIENVMNGLIDGTVKLIDSDGSGGVDAVMVESFESYVFKYYDAQSDMIFSKFDNTCLDVKTYEYVTILDAEGTFITASEIVPSSVLNIARTGDGERIKIVVGGESVEGSVDEVQRSADKNIYKIGGKAYDSSSQYKTDIDKLIKVGDDVKVYINMFNKIVAAEGGKSDGYKVGYLMNAAIVSEGLGDAAKLYIYTSGGEIVTLECADTINVDGTRYRDNIRAALAAMPDCSVSGDNTSITPQIIRYKQNGDGLADKIDTYNLGSEDFESSLSRTLAPTSDTMKFSARVGKTNVLSADTKVYHVPYDDEVMAADASDFNISNEKSINNRYSFKLECYKLRGDSEYVDVVVFRRKPTDTEQNDWWNSSIFLVKDVAESADENSDKFYAISGLMNGSENTVNVYENDLYKTGNVKLSEIKEGDLIRYRTNYKGRVHDIELLYRPSGFDFKNWKNYNEQTSLFDATYDQYFQLSFGYVSEVSEHNVGWGYKSGTQTDEMIDLSSINCMFYDSGAKDGQKIYTNRSSSVRDFKSFGDKCDKIIVQLKNGNVYAAVVYR